jgi:hypothetical protein
MRDYDPLVGRYVESDPIGLHGGSVSTYAYGEGDPAIYIDPLGLGTFALGFEGSGSWIQYASISFQASISWNSAAMTDLSQWRIGGIFSAVPITGVSSGFSGAAGIVATYSPANCPEEFRGWSGTFGGSAGVGIVGGFAVGNVGYGNPKTYNFFLGRGAVTTPAVFSLPFEVHSAASWTAAGSFSLARGAGKTSCGCARSGGT